MGKGEAVQDPTVVTGMFPLNNSYACVLFDSGAERSIVILTVVTGKIFKEILRK